MRFVHDDADFDALLQIVAAEIPLNIALVEKDYWVTHTLWALHAQGFEVWFKGGTSLSKGFDLIERFSEDLDLKIEPGAVSALSPVVNWKSLGTRASAARKAYFETLAGLLSIPGATVGLGAAVDPHCRSANLQVDYQARHETFSGSVLRPFVLLEVGEARVTPFVERDITSFVHRHLEREGLLGEFRDNRPRLVRCVHPLVTLLEKLDALMRRFSREDLAPATFVRHFEDAARISNAAATLPDLPDYSSVGHLAEEMLAKGQLAALPSAEHAAFTPSDDDRWLAVGRAFDAIAPMFWGPRLSLNEACAEIRRWVEGELGR